MVERVNRTIKGRLRTAMQTQNTTNWVKVLPVVLAELRMTRTDTLGGLSPYEIVMVRPFPVPWRQVTALGGLADLEVRRSEYTAGLLSVLNEYWERVNQNITNPPKTPTHPYKPGDQIMVKKFERKGFSDPPFSEPTTVFAVTRTGKHDAADNALSLLGGYLAMIAPIVCVLLLLLCMGPCLFRCLMDRVYALASSLVPHRSDYVFMAQTVQQPIYASLEPSCDVAVSASV
ncbi:hypothetical protein SRHO_G00322140 [Serrasalmus rhombeus]